MKSSSLTALCAGSPLRTLLRSAVISGVIVTSAAAPSGATVQNDNIRFRQLSIDQGLSQGLVSCILQDSRGFMWMGTLDGLNRYDGYDFRSYHLVPYDSRSLSRSSVTCLMEDSDGVLWVGTTGGLNRYSRDSDDFTRILHDPDDPASLPDDLVLSLNQGTGSTIWMGTGSGVVKYDRVSGGFETVPFADGESPIGGPDPVCFVTEDITGLVWAGTNTGLFRLDRSSGILVRFRQPGGDQDLVNSQTACIYTDGAGYLWIATEVGPGRMNPDTGRFELPELAPDSPMDYNALGVNWIDEDSDGRLWVVSQGWGVWIYSADRRRAVNMLHDPFEPSTISTNAVRRVYHDRSDGMWIGTNGYGAAVWYPQQHKFPLYRIEASMSAEHASRSVRTIYEDRRGILWVGGYYGLVKLDRRTKTWTRWPSERFPAPGGFPVDNVYTICEDPRSDGTAIWIGLEGGGLTRLDMVSDVLTTYPSGENTPGSLNGKLVYSLAAEPGGMLWIGSEVGLSRFDPATGRFEQLFDNSGIRAIQLDNEGSVWAGTIEDGVLRVDRGTGHCETYRHNLSDIASLSYDHVLAIHKSRTGIVWAGTNGGGLNRLDWATGTFSHYLKKDGLPNNVVYGILEDDSGSLWLSTNHGISRFDPVTESFQNFDAGDGLQSNEFNASAYYKSRSGEMFFGGIEGFNSFFPKDIKPNPHPPEVVITGLQIANRDVPVGGDGHNGSVLDRSITETRHLRLSYRDDVVTFTCAALHYELPERNAYAYKLEGLDDDWNDIGTRRFITFTDLRPGDYRLRIKAANADGVWNDTGVDLAITVVPPPWGTLWFRSIMVVSLLLALVTAHRLRTYYILRRNRELDEINTELRSQMEERLRAENQLRESEEKYRVVAQSAREGIITIDESGAIVLANESVSRIFGYTPDDLTGSAVTRLIPDFPSGADGVTALEDGGGTESDISFRGVRRDGRELSLELSIGEFSVKQRRLFTVVIRDVTERKQLEEQFMQVQKMDAVGRLAGGIAHDLNNLLTVIQGRSAEVMARLTGKDPVNGDIDEIMSAARRAESLTRQLLAFGRKQMLQPRVLNLNRLIEDMGRLLNRLLGETIDIELRLEDGLGNVRADPGQIEQVILNLVVNARDAMPDGGRIVIETRELDEESSQSKIFNHLKGKSYIQLTISDSGVGMNAETQQKVFDPFFTTKAPHEGTGLGLSTVYGIVKQSDGSIWVNSEPGKGSIFYVCLPRVDETASPEIKPAASEASLLGSETILLVEDEDGVRRLIGDALRRRGYNVMEATNGIRGLDLFERNEQDIDLILTDAVMPEMGGLEFINRITDRLVETRVLFMSGYAEEMVTADSQRGDHTAFIQKPFTPEELIARIRELLGGNPSV